MKIAIASGKGGTGKTTVAVNLATYLSWDENARKIVLCDLDVEEPNSRAFIKGILFHSQIQNRFVPAWDESKCIGCGYCSQLCNFNALVGLPNKILVFPELCHSCFMCSELCPEEALPMIERRTGVLNHYLMKDLFALVEGRLDVGQVSAVPLIQQTKEYVDGRYSEEDLIIYDCPPGTSCSMIEAIKEVDFVVLVTEPTPFGLHDLKLAVQAVRDMDLDFGVIINRYGIGNRQVEDYCMEENIQVLGLIRDSKEVAVLYSKGESALDKVPAFADEFKEIYKAIEQHSLKQVEHQISSNKL